MVIATSTFLSDSTKYIRDILSSNITDPESASRAGRERFVMTSYPERPVRYPIITVREVTTSSTNALGMQSNATWNSIQLEIRVWGRNQKEKDSLTEQVIQYIRNNQVTNTIANNLFGFRLLNTINIDENGDNTPKSKIMRISFNVLLSGT